jgi:hypothetical protein
MLDSGAAADAEASGAAGVSSDFWQAAKANSVGTRARIRNLRITSSFVVRAGPKRNGSPRAKILNDMPDFKPSQVPASLYISFCIFGIVSKKILIIPRAACKMRTDPFCFLEDGWGVGVGICIAR